MAKRKSRKRKGSVPAVIESGHELAKVQLSDADKAILGEVALNRRAILKLGQLSLDHERRLVGLEEAVGELAGEEEEPLEIEAEDEEP